MKIRGDQRADDTQRLLPVPCRPISRLVSLLPTHERPCLRIRIPYRAATKISRARVLHATPEAMLGRKPNGPGHRPLHHPSARQLWHARPSLVGDFAPLPTGRLVVLGVFEIDYSNVFF